MGLPPQNLLKLRDPQGLRSSWLPLRPPWGLPGLQLPLGRLRGSQPHRSQASAKVLGLAGLRLPLPRLLGLKGCEVPPQGPLGLQGPQQPQWSLVPLQHALSLMGPQLPLWGFRGVQLLGLKDQWLPLFGGLKSRWVPLWGPLHRKGHLLPVWAPLGLLGPGLPLVLGLEGMWILGLKSRPLCLRSSLERLGPRRFL